MTTPAHARAPAFDDRPVLASAPLKAGHAREELSRVGDPSWDLGPAVFRENARRCHVTVHFDVLEHPDVQAAMRAYLYARLNVDLPGYRPKLPPASIRQAFNRARRFFAFARLTLGRLDLGRIDHALVDAYARHLRDDPARRPVIVGHLLEVVSDLYHYRDHLAGGGLAFEPWGGQSPARVAGYRHVRENRTPRFPEEVIAALLAWSLRYVTAFAGDILAARRELDRLEARRDRLVTADAGLPDADRRQRRRTRLKAYFDRRRREGRGAPIWGTAHNGKLRVDPNTGTVTPPINAHLLHLHAGIDVQTEPGAHLMLTGGEARLIDAVATELGVEVGGMDTPISIDPESGRPWRERFDAKTLAHEERMLQAAAYIVCAYLTGMRDCEVQAMRRGCLTIARSEDGLIERHRIRSTIYKRRRAVGEAASWVTIEPVADAIAVLERLSAGPARASGSDTLWPVLRPSAVTKTHLSSEVVRQLNAFRDHLNTAFGSPDAPIIPSGPDGKPWRITTRQFRRTIAWHIANRPFGTVAGMIQYKHASVAAFEGYAGTSASGFRAEVEAQRRLGQTDDLLDYFDQRQGGASLGGPAGPRIARTLDDAAVKLGPLPAMIADRARLRVMLASVARTFHVGPLADCFFDPATALCLKRVTTPDPAQPLTALCEPTRCPNACITARHRPAWERAAADAKAHLRERRISDLQRQALQRELDRLTAVIAGSILPRRRPPRLLADSCAGRRARATASPSSASLRPWRVREPPCARRERASAAGDGPRRENGEQIMPASPRVDVYARVTDAIVAVIEAGTGTWRMPWHHSGADVTRPTNVASGKPYRGINTVSLWAAAYGSGYTSGVWGTYRQWQALGAQVRKGEHASLGVLWKEFRAKGGEASDDDGDHRRLFAKAFSLFNADQVDGYALEQGPVLPESERLAAAEAFIAALGIDTVYGSASAYYHIAEDRIHMPDFSAFHDAHGFYATHIHEAAHASGAAHRLDRDFSAKWTRHALAMEEATAELTASFLLADLGIAHEPRPDHAAYIASWLQLLKDEPRAIFTAASKAQAAADWMHAQQP